MCNKCAFNTKNEYKTLFVTYFSLILQRKMKLIFKQKQREYLWRED